MNVTVPSPTVPSPRAMPVLGFRRSLALITAVAAVWRYGYLFVVSWDRPLLLNDSWYYSGQAVQLTRGEWFRELFVDMPGAEHGPLTPLVLAPLSWMDDPVPWQRLVTATIGVGVVWLVGLLGREVGGDRVGLVAAGLAAVYPNLWLNDGLVMSESLATALVVGALLVLTRARHDVSVSRLVVFGVLVGLATLTRSELALFVPLGWVLLVRWSPDRATAVRAVAVTGAAAVLVVLPWTVFNLTRFAEPVLLTTNDGTTLIGSYCEATFDGPYRAGWFIGCVVDHPSWQVSEEPSVRSAAQRRAAVAYAREHVARLPEMAVLRIARTFDLYQLDDLVAQDVGEERPRWGVWLGIVSFWALGAAAIVGARRTDREIRLVLALPLVTTVLVSAAFYGAHRFRTPLEPVIVVLAAVAVIAAVDRRRATSAVAPVPPAASPAATSAAMPARSRPDP